jgi:hypothetical protein
MIVKVNLKKMDCGSRCLRTTIVSFFRFESVCGSRRDIKMKLYRYKLGVKVCLKEGTFLPIQKSSRNL